MGKSKSINMMSKFTPINKSCITSWALFAGSVRMPVDSLWTIIKHKNIYIALNIGVRPL